MMKYHPGRPKTAVSQENPQNTAFQRSSEGADKRCPLKACEGVGELEGVVWKECVEGVAKRNGLKGKSWKEWLGREGLKVKSCKSRF